MNIEVDPGDRDCLRFLWVDDYKKEAPEVIVYRFCRVVFGLNASPFLLNATIRHHLNKYVSTDSGFVQKMLEGFYVDDLVSGGNTNEEAFELYNKARLRMEDGGFRLRKWKTNDPKLRRRIEQSEQSMNPSKVIPTLEEDETYAKSKLDPQSGTKGEKVLGLGWNIEHDTIHFNFEHISQKKERLEPTKRNLLSLLSSLFDPLGLISGVVVTMKILFQDVCKNKLGWDEVFNDDLKKRLDKWVQDLVATREICLDRCLYDTSAGKVSKCYLHGFGDASKSAYCAVVYLVYHCNDGEARARLIASKTRVAPLKELSIPRLELITARILAQLVNTIQSALSSQMKLDGVRYWLDSKTALCWIRNHGEWKQFVKHRVNEILQLTNKNEWAYVSTHENPADIRSRGVLASQLKDNQLWWNGPTWLLEKPNNWPPISEIGRTPESSEEERKPVTNLCVKEGQNRLRGLEAVISIERYSRLTKLLNVIAWVRRAASNFRKNYLTTELTAEEIKVAEIEWIKIAQHELTQQDNYKQLIKKLGLVEEDGILKCTGRLGNSDLDLDVQKPILLPRKHRFTWLIIEACHQRVHHCGVRSTLAELRSRFWVPNGRQTVKKILGACLTCKKLIRKSYRAPATAALPEFRVTRAPPFSRVAIDFAGPLYAKNRVGDMEKVYIALFSCCVTRAIHLELVDEMSAEAFKRCLRKFTTRRGMPSLMVSDNAKTFQATEKDLNKLFNHPEIKSYFNNAKIEWKFNLERASWWGGFFERMVGCVKQCLRKTLGKARLTKDELATVLVEVECTLNSRPLTYEYDEVGEEVLTPSHLMFGRRINSLPHMVDEPEEAMGRQECSARFRYLSNRLEHFWSRWKKEYLVGLREFDKNKGDGSAIAPKEGDVVIVEDEDRKRSEWKLGVIVELIEGRDKIVRGAKVRVVAGGRPNYLSRPVQKLYLLEIKSQREGGWVGTAPKKR